MVRISAFSLKNRTAWGVNGIHSLNKTPSGSTKDGKNADVGRFTAPCHVWAQRIFMNTIKIFIAPVTLLLVSTLFIQVYAFAGTLADSQLSLDSGHEFYWSWLKLLAWSICSVAYPLAIIFVAILAKWVLVGCYRVQQVPMFSCFIWRSDLAYELELPLRSVAAIFDGTPIINWIYRALGVRIGKDVFILGTSFMEHDLTEIDDGAVVAGATLQTHLYEDRMYKTGRVCIGREALVAPGGFALYGSTIERQGSLGPASLLMRNERFEPLRRHFGLPSSAAEVVSFEAEEERAKSKRVTWESRNCNGTTRKDYEAQLDLRREELREAQLALNRALLRAHESESVV